MILVTDTIHYSRKFHSIDINKGKEVQFNLGEYLLDDLIIAI